MNTTVFSSTPSVIVRDARGLPVCDIQYHRHPDTPAVSETRLTRHEYDIRGALLQSADPRLHAAGLANVRYLTDLAGYPLCTQSADAGITVALSDAAGRPVLAVSATGVIRTWQYEGTGLPGRPLCMTELATGDAARISECFVYACNTEAEKGNNLAGQCVRHYDTAGMMQTDSVALTGIPLTVTRRLLKDADNPDAVADWQGGDASAWNDQLDGEAYASLATADATGTVLTTTDAAGNMQRRAYDVAGQLKGSWLRLSGGQEQMIITSVRYSAAGQKLREEHGNGVVTTYTYEPQTQRLTRITTARPAGPAAGAKVLQDLRYEYDPVGNVLKVTNGAEEPRFWRNQRVVPESRYTYDSLYQLVSVTGREQANAGQQRAGQLPSVVILPADSSTLTNYSRIYRYDTAGNLTQISHSSPTAGNSHTTDITVSDRSNRAVVSERVATGAQVEAQFTAGGQQTALATGQRLSWNGPGELAQVGAEAGTRESYRYDSSSQRVLKVGTTGMQTQRVVYLPGLERRSTIRGGKETESLQVITVGEAGGVQVRVLHWDSGQPAGISNDLVRYSYGDLIQSTEVDGEGSVISQEEYYPYGGTAVLCARSAVEVGYKTIRYSGKERDATGLYYYGYRYYQPWAGRWLSADPAGTVDGLNLFRMCRNNPVNYWDNDGKVATNEDISMFRRLYEHNKVKDKYKDDFSKLLGKISSTHSTLKKIKDKDEQRWAAEDLFYESYSEGLIYGLSAPRERYIKSNKELKMRVRTIDEFKILKDDSKYSRVDVSEFKEFLRENDKYKEVIGGRGNNQNIRRKAKGGLEWATSKGMHVHFVLDELDINAVINKNFRGKNGDREPGSDKKNRSITGSELRWLYRHWKVDNVRENVTFWVEGAKVPAPWEKEVKQFKSLSEVTYAHTEWLKYKPS